MTKNEASGETVFAVTVSGELLRMSKTRRRAGHAFGKAPLYFREVPAEILADKYLRVREVPLTDEMSVIGEEPAEGKKAASKKAASKKAAE